MKDLIFNFESEARSINIVRYIPKDKEEQDFLLSNLGYLYTLKEDQNHPIGIEDLRQLMSAQILN